MILLFFQDTEVSYLNKVIFIGEKRYLHMHPGKLPIERGSTTIYYSILKRKKINCYSIFYV